jgi:hypothetical protein
MSELHTDELRTGELHTDDLRAEGLHKEKPRTEQWCTGHKKGRPWGRPSYFHIRPF